MAVNLEQIENRIRELVEIHIPGLLSGQTTEKIFAQQLAQAMNENVVSAEGHQLAPSIFTLVTRPEEVDIWKDGSLRDALSNTIQTVGYEAGFEFAAPPTFLTSTDASLKPGQIRVVASHKAKEIAATNSIPLETPTQAEPETIPENAFLIVDGVKVFPLKGTVVNIGRRLENHLVIDDPRVSRTHAQIRIIKGRYVIFDLNSTGGTFVNGQRNNQSVLYPGDVISLAGVTLVFGQDNPPPRPDLKATGPLNEQAAERPTAVLKERTDIRKRKQ